MAPTPRLAAILLLRLGTLVFPLGLLATCLSPEASRPLAARIIASYASCILSFIGGLWQAAGLSEGVSRDSVLLVVGGIAIALLSFVAALSSWVNHEVEEDAGYAYLTLLAGLYGVIAVIESKAEHIRCDKVQRVLLSAERAPSMAVAAVTLVLVKQLLPPTALLEEENTPS